MKIFGILLLVSLLISLELPSCCLPQTPLSSIPSGNNIGKPLRHSGKMPMKCICSMIRMVWPLLQEHQIEGLGLLKHYDSDFQLLQPYMELGTIFQLFQTHGDQFEALLELFQAETISSCLRRVWKRRITLYD